MSYLRRAQQGMVMTAVTVVFPFLLLVNLVTCVLSVDASSKHRALWAVEQKPLFTILPDQRCFNPDCMVIWDNGASSLDTFLPLSPQPLPSPQIPSLYKERDTNFRRGKRFYFHILLPGVHMCSLKI
jgi:hypothetical protein